MPIEPSELEEIIVSAFPDGVIEVCDTTGDRDHYEVRIRSTAFRGKPLIDQHRMVQKALEGYNIHAVSIKTSIQE